MEVENQSKCAEAKESPIRSIAHVTDCGYAGIPKAVVAPVFELACSVKPSVDSMITQTKTQLDHDIVSALIEAAVRLSPFDNTPRFLSEAQQKKYTNVTPRHSFRRADPYLRLPLLVVGTQGLLRLSGKSFLGITKRKTTKKVCGANWSGGGCL